ncbi:MAG: hypothetical protein KBC21_03420 [Candidatus Pacebacteria bacterium]|nr:hypothetical protein [Candidatus Paceibacterota bacterium]
MSPKLLNILLVALPSVLYFGYLAPSYTGEEGLVWTPEKSIKTLQVENVQYANTLSQIDIIKGAAENLNKDYLSFDNDVKEKLTTMLPDAVDPVKIRNEVIIIAAKSGMAVEGLKVEKDAKGDKGINFYKVSFSVRGKYAAFKTLMENYEKNKRFFSLEQAMISRPVLEEKGQEKKDTQEDILDFSVTFRVYYMK